MGGGQFLLVDIRMSVSSFRGKKLRVIQKGGGEIEKMIDISD